MSEYAVIGTGVKNNNSYIQPYQFSSRRKVFIVPVEFLKYELGMDIAGYQLTAEQASILECELRIRQELPADTMIRGMQLDPYYDSVRIYTMSPHFDPVPQGVQPPEQLIEYAPY